MRINGFEQIKGFYSWVFENQERDIKPQHISLYIFMVNQNNRNNWIEWFKMPFDLAMAGSCISSKKTYYSCLDDLQKWGLIDYEKGANAWRAPKIKLEVLKDTSTVPQCEPQQNFYSTTTDDSSEQLDEQLTEPQGTHNIKPITINLKPTTGNNNEPGQAPEIVMNYSFEDFWNDYDKKVGKKEKLIPKWQKLKDSEREKIKEYIPRYKKSQPKKQFRKNPETFLNNKGWEDELIYESNANTGKTIEQNRAERTELAHFSGSILADIAAKHGIGCS